MSNAIVALRQNANQVVDAGMPSILPVLKEAGIPPERFRATFASAVINTPSILDCDQQSIIQALVNCATDRLMPDNREAALVPFRTKVKDPDTNRDVYIDKVQYMPMIAGVRKRALELGGVLIDAQEVCRGDIFEHQLGDNPYIDHKHAPFGTPRGEVVGAYAIFRDKDLKVLHREIMDREAIEAARNVSRAKNGPAWNNFYGEMAKKTVARRGGKSVPNLDDRLRQIIERDDEYTDFNQESVERAERNIEHNPLLDERRRSAPSSTGQEQRNSTSQVDGSSPSGRANQEQGEPGNDGGQNGGEQNGGEQRTKIARMEPSVFQEYATALARLATMASLEKGQKTFWGDDRPWPKSGPDNDLATKILNMNKDRVDGKRPAEGMLDEIDAAIAASFEGL